MRKQVPHEGVHESAQNLRGRATQVGRSPVKVISAVHVAARTTTSRTVLLLLPEVVEVHESAQNRLRVGFRYIFSEMGLIICQSGHMLVLLVESQSRKAPHRVYWQRVLCHTSEGPDRTDTYGVGLPECKGT